MKPTIYFFTVTIHTVQYIVLFNNNLIYVYFRMHVQIPT